MPYLHLSKTVDNRIQKQAKRMVKLLTQVNDRQPDSPVIPWPRRETIYALEEVQSEIQFLLEGV
jgi:hypothetical protein